jgi:hypothetical protein
MGLSPIAMLEIERLDGIILEEQVRQFLIFLTLLYACRGHVLEFLIGVGVIVGVVCEELIQVQLGREERIGILVATVYLLGIITLDLPIEVYQILDPGFVAISLVGIEGKDVYLFIVEHANGAQMHKRLEASHACAANGNDK